MSFTIIKAGILDTIQDCGRNGYQSSGINPGGVMDRFSARLSNALLGKNFDSPVIEIHFPSPVIRFNSSTILCLAGADFSPVINNHKLSLHQPVIINKGAILSFTKNLSGARCYLSILQNLELKQWLNSYSTNLKAGAGGFEGRALRAGDNIRFDEISLKNIDSKHDGFNVLPWKAEPQKQIATDTIELIEGNEWNWLTDESKQLFLQSRFQISTTADRMGFRLKGVPLKVKETTQLVSSGVGFGTLQLLPNGQLIVLMADHQTTGGYPRIAHVISAHLPCLAQKKPNNDCIFSFTDVATAEQKLLQQHQYLQSVQHAASFKIKDILQ